MTKTEKGHEKGVINTLASALVVHKASAS